MSLTISFKEKLFFYVDDNYELQNFYCLTFHLCFHAQCTFKKCPLGHNKVKACDAMCMVTVIVFSLWMRISPEVVKKKPQQECVICDKR